MKSRYGNSWKRRNKAYDGIVSRYNLRSRAFATIGVVARSESAAVAVENLQFRLYLLRVRLECR